MKKHLPLLILALLVVPTFWRMLSPGIFSMHDFHVFRLFEFHKCIKDLQIPCRWSPDSTYEYGQPLFNFYGQLSYLPGELWVLLGGSIIDGVKFSFIFSLIASAYGMFLLGKKLWKDELAAMMSALVYTYAPYRSVDVWVRGALPEAMSFVFFPLLTLYFIDFLETKKRQPLIIFSLLLAGLIVTHNLSALMYMILLGILSIYLIIVSKKFSAIFPLIAAGILAVGVAAFYLLPVAIETRYITLGEITEGYYIYTSHFVSLKQLLLSNFWGYGGSTFGEEDGLSLAVGYVQWVLPLITLILALLFKKIKQLPLLIVFIAMGWFMLFLAHARSLQLWQNLSFFAYIQFPWRFLGSATFAFAAASGAFIILLNKRYKAIVLVLVTALLISVNFKFFREDIWYKVTDSQFFSGSNYKMQTSSALTDFWPRYGTDVPSDFAPQELIFMEGSGYSRREVKKSNYMLMTGETASASAVVSFPIVYFPGWNIYENGIKIKSFPAGKYGLLSTNISTGYHNLNARFENTPVRLVGNVVSSVSLLGIALILIKLRR